MNSKLSCYDRHMVTMQGKYLMRDGLKIGYVSGSYVYNHDGVRMGYVQGNMVFDRVGKKLAYIEGEYVIVAHSGQNLRLEDVVMNIEAGGLSNALRVAIKFFLGD